MPLSTLPHTQSQLYDTENPRNARDTVASSELAIVESEIPRRPIYDKRWSIR